MDLLIGVLGAGIGSGIMAIILARLQRKWKKDDQQDAILAELSKIQNRMDRMEADDEEQEIKHARIRILRFRDECSHNVLHSQEHFEQVIEDVDAYETYCADHPDFKNNKAVASIQLIKDTYKRRLLNHDFI